MADKRIWSFSGSRVPVALLGSHRPGVEGDGIGTLALDLFLFCFFMTFRLTLPGFDWKRALGGVGGHQPGDDAAGMRISAPGVKREVRGSLTLLDAPPAGGTAAGPAR